MYSALSNQANVCSVSQAKPGAGHTHIEATTVQEAEGGGGAGGGGGGGGSSFRVQLLGKLGFHPGFHSSATFCGVKHVQVLLASVESRCCNPFDCQRSSAHVNS